MDVGETLAMALASLGDFTRAIGIQRGVMSAAERSGNMAAVARMKANLALYERRMPCREPWPSDQALLVDQSQIKPAS